MLESVTIAKKKKGNADEYEFAGLRRLGLEYVQQLSGEIWSDYNIHDPGVTILEQLCYALTDLVYRADYAVKDLLTDSRDQLDFKSLGLYPPETILPGRALTFDDYRKVLFDALPGLDNVWLETLDSAYSGLYRILVSPGSGQGDDAAGRRQLAAEVAEVFSRHRNLCEDIGEIVILRPVTCRLEAKAAISGEVATEEILAEIYHHCGVGVAARLDFMPYAEEGLGEPEQILNGPFSRHGRLSDSQLVAGPEFISRGRLFSIIKEVAGVERVDSFDLRVDQQAVEQIRADGEIPCYCLEIPVDKQGVGVELTKNGRAAAFSFKIFKARHDELSFKRRARAEKKSNSPEKKNNGAEKKSNGAEPKALYEAPRGVYRNPGRYYSIQNQFPDIYGINYHGIPDCYSDEEKAAAAQLKAYLLHFERIMADYLAQLENIPRLFSISGDLRRSYYRQHLDNATIPGVDKVTAPGAEKFFARLSRRFDDYRDRKNRLLDYLLALYGERFSGKSLRNFNFYHQRGEFEDLLIANKARLLKHMARLNRDRGAAFNYRASAWNSAANICGLQFKVSVLLAWKHVHCRSLVRAMLKQGLELVDDDHYQGVLVSSPGPGRAADDQLLAGAERVVATDLPEAETLGGLREKIQKFEPITRKKMFRSLLRNGVNIKRYRLTGPAAADQGIQVMFQPADGADWWSLGSFAGTDEAREAVNALRHFLIYLNMESEGLHLVEHILLRPAGTSGVSVTSGGSGSRVGSGAGNGSGQELEGFDFYSQRVSVVLPAWTARCALGHFQRLVEETVRLNCPAQVMPSFYWLDFVQMCEFENLYKNWLEEKQRSEPGDGALEGAAAGLTAFLRQHAPPALERW